MSLKTLRAEIVAELGIESTGDQLTLLDARINKAAKELYDSSDLMGSLREIIVSYDDDTKLLSLPSWVGQIRGIRHNETGIKHDVNDMRPRYAYNGYGERSLNFRYLGKQSLGLQIDNYSTLRFVLPLAEPEDVNITIIGKTTNAQRSSEVVTITSGSLTGESTGNYVGAPDVIKKAATCNSDISILQADDTLLGILYNDTLESTFTILQIEEDYILSNSNIRGPFDVLYKEAFKPMVHADDIFLHGDYDNAIYYKYKEHHFARKPDGTTDAIASVAKCDALIQQVEKDYVGGKVMLLDFAPNKFYGLIRRHLWQSNRYSYRQ